MKVADGALVFWSRGRSIAANSDDSSYADRSVEICRAEKRYGLINRGAWSHDICRLLFISSARRDLFNRLGFVQMRPKRFSPIFVVSILGSVFSPLFVLGRTKAAPVCQILIA
jgi:hypothetical protein